MASAARPYGGWGNGGVAPSSSSVALRRVFGTLHEPNAWAVGILLATGVALIARHPIARVIGTEVDNPAAPAPAATAPARTPATYAPSVAAPLIAVPTHAPRDPFAALINATDQSLAPAAATVKKPAIVTVTPTTPSAPATVTPTAGSCNVQMHHVVAGDSLWTLAARAVHSNTTGRVTIAWHRLYDANRAVVGPNPSLLRIGTAVCVPTNL